MKTKTTVGDIASSQLFQKTRPRLNRHMAIMKEIAIVSREDLEVTAVPASKHRWTVTFRYEPRADLSEMIFDCTPHAFVYESMEDGRMVSSWEEQYPSSEEAAVEQMRHEWDLMFIRMEQHEETRRYNLSHGTAEFLQPVDLDLYRDQYVVRDESGIVGFTKSLFDAHRMIRALPEGRHSVSTARSWDGSTDVRGYLLKNSLVFQRTQA